ncbi:MAG TPA: hypothetical protein VF304_13895 [Casimicrobiaceae bacterium]
MCYEFDSWHWKARAKEMHKAQLKTSAMEQKSADAKLAQESERERPEVKETEKVPV